MSSFREFLETTTKERRLRRAARRSQEIVDGIRKAKGPLAQQKHQERHRSVRFNLRLHGDKKQAAMAMGIPQDFLDRFVELIKSGLSPKDAVEFIRDERGRMREGAHEGGGGHTSKPGYDQNLSRPEGLAYVPPQEPETKSKKSEKLDKLFKGKKS